MNKQSKFKKTLFSLLCSCALLLVGLTFQPGNAEATTFRMGHVLKPGDSAYIGAQKFAELVKEYTDGRVTIKVFPAGQLGSNRKLFTQLKSGAIDIHFPPFPYLADTVPEFTVFNAGYMFDSWEQMEKILNSPQYGMSWKEELIKKGGLRIIGQFYYGARNLTTTGKPVYKPADVVGLKIRAVPHPMSIATVKGLGANPTPVAWTETFQALRQGIVDGQENPIPVLYAAKFYEVQKYLVKTEHVRSALPFVIREKSWNRLSKKDQQALVKAAGEAAELATVTTEKNTLDLVSDLKSRGMTIIELNDAQLKAFKTSVRKEVAKSFDGKALPKGLLAEVAEFIEN